MTSHNVKVFGGLGVVFLTAVFPYFTGASLSPAEIFTAIVAGLIAVEHTINGNTSSVS